MCRLLALLCLQELVADDLRTGRGYLGIYVPDVVFHNIMFSKIISTVVCHRSHVGPKDC